MEAAQKHYPDYICTFELSLHNADKGDLSPDSLSKRMEQFEKLQLNLALTNLPLFVEKAQVFPKSVFVIGWDTYIRLVDPKYYPAGLELALQRFRD